MFWTWVQDKMDEQDIPSIRDLEKKAGVSNGTISVRKNQLKMPTVVIAEGLCRALRVTWVELWVQAGYIPPGILDTHITPEEQELILNFRELKPDRREAALDAVRGLGPNRLTFEMIEEIMSLADRRMYFEAVSRLLENTNIEQQQAMQEFLNLLDRRALGERKEEAEAVEIEQGGRTTT